ncbi:HIT family protein [Aerococcaceae bacterium DSM 111021]|nr:HIT family protein [Aerococcaceae bacterium DSM 111021]
MTDCIFCKIVNGEIPSAKVYEDNEVVAFLDMSQATPGHTLVVPKKHVENIFEYDESVAVEIAKRLPNVANAIKAAYPEMKGMNIVNNNGELAYQSVFHTHWHLLPRYSEEDKFSIEFSNNQDSYTQEEFNERAALIRSYIKEN